ncbi:pilus assembly PilX family protein [Propionivibrio sp.]|uniref:pilus assembly PilX family protein n=1 Tax=Propionivibrio sp. TaxID=2212460 RepID=UPI00272DF081|nr:PilX N-terminal domain-containing pilus assembly protein [Propionivibrio sp.]
MKKGCSQSRQRGITLITSLLMLVMITILALSVMNTSVFEERMAGNTRDRALAFEAAEYALREAQQFLAGAVLPEFTSTGGTSGAYFKGLDTSPSGQLEELYWRDTHDWTTKSITTAESNAVLSGQAQPRYVIEEYQTVSCAAGSVKWPPPPPRTIYKITARGQGRTTEAVVILQTFYDRGCS